MGPISRLRPGTVSVVDAIAACGLPRGEARMLLEAASGLSREAQLRQPEAALDAATLVGFEQLCARRRAGEPVAYLIGRRAFHGIELEVSPAVLIPRPETELLVDLALARVAEGARSILDLGTGSGAVAIAIARHAPAANVCGVDCSDEALAIAGRNAGRLGAHVQFLRGDWFGSLQGRVFDVIVGNPPYVATGDPHLDSGDLRFEPRHALESGIDGLADIRRILADAPSHLGPAGRLYLEHGHDQAARVRALFASAGFASVGSVRDLAGIERVCEGMLPAERPRSG